MQFGTLVKKIHQINKENKTLLVKGAGTDTLSTEQMGLIPYHQITGVAFIRISPEGMKILI